MSSKRMPVMTGGCQCGAVRFALYAVPQDAYICHCRMCQKSVGGPFAGFAMVASHEFRWTRGEPAAWASSSAGQRQFCSACGTPLGYRYTSGPETDTQFLTTGSFDDSKSVVPRIQTGMEGKVDWIDRVDLIAQRPLGKALGADNVGRIVNYQHPDHDTPEGWGKTTAAAEAK